MKIVFFGSSSFSIPILNRLLNSHHKVVLVVTVPASKKGRGQKMHESDVEVFSKEHEIPVIAPEKLKDSEVLSKLKEISADCFVVASYGKMLPNELLDTCPYPLNVHPSLLPKYRGASPIVSQLLDGITESGVSIARITEKLDAGEIYTQRKVILTEDDDAVSAEQTLTKAGGDLLLDVLKSIKKKSAQLTPQDETIATYVSKLKKKNGQIDWKQNATRIHNQIRAFVKWPTAYTFWNGKRIKILKSKVNSKHPETTLNPGTVIEINKSGSFSVTCGSGGILQIDQLQPEAGKIMDPHSFALGHKIAVGQRFE